MSDYIVSGKKYLAQFPDFRLIGRDEELMRLISILVRDQASSVILSGSRGVGCEHLCRGVQAAKQAANAPFDIVSKRLFWLDVNGLFSSGNGGEINEAFQKIVRRLDRTTNSAMIIEDTRDFLEAARNYGCSHFINLIVSSVHERRTQFILIAGDDDLEHILKAHNDFRELFTVMTLDEPAGDTLRSIVADAAGSLVKHHGIKIDDSAIDAAIELTNKYQTRDAGLSTAQPERSITLIDRAFSAYRLKSHSSAPEHVSADQWASYQSAIRAAYEDMRNGEDEIVKLEEQIAAATAGKDNDGLESEEVSNFRSKLSQYEKAVKQSKSEFARITAEINDHLVLKRDEVVEEFSAISGISASKLTQNDLDKLRLLEGALKKRIFGQDRAVEKLANAIKIAKAGRRSNGEPQAAFLFLGPSGVGKTEIAKALAAIMLDDERALTRFDMSEYMEKHAVAKLIGAPPGYEGFEAGGVLTNLMRKNGNRILLFDEIEKAHPDVFNIFLQILSDGRLTDNVGRTVSFEDSSILMTTNIGQPHFLDPDMPFEEAERLAMIDLSSTYRSELLNRFAGRQNIICFNRLELPSINKIVSREIAKINAGYADRGISVAFVTESAQERFCAARYEPAVGARGLPGYIKANIEPVIVNHLIDKPDATGIFVVDYGAAGLSIYLEKTHVSTPRREDRAA